MKKRFLQILPIAVVFALIFAGCSSDGDDGASRDTDEKTVAFTFGDLTLGDDYVDAYSFPQTTLNGLISQPHLYVGTDNNYSTDILLLYTYDTADPNGGICYFPMTFQSGERTTANPFLGTWKWEDSAKGYYITLTFTATNYTAKIVYLMSDYDVPVNGIFEMTALEMWGDDPTIFDSYNT
jgi:hypothetical protein